MNYDNWKQATPPSGNEYATTCMDCDDDVTNDNIEGFCSQACYDNHVDNMANAIATISTSQKDFEIAKEFLLDYEPNVYKDMMQERNSELLYQLNNN